MKKVAIIMGSDSDLPVVEKAFAVLDEYGVPFEVHVYSAHRTPIEARDFAVNARDNGFGAVIAAAGKAAHLAVYLVTEKKKSIAEAKEQAEKEVLATFGIEGDFAESEDLNIFETGDGNAALLAIQILAVSDEELALKLKAAREKASQAVLEKDKAISDKFNK